MTILTRDTASLARDLWRALEPYHAVVYFAPEAKATFAAEGLKGWWMGYFASRAAAMGPVPAEIVVATFYNFHPSMVRRAIPDAWRYSTPGDVLRARVRLADVSLRRLLGDEVCDGADVARAAQLARSAAEACSCEGRALFAGHASLPWPDEPHLVLWHAATLLREHRGDGHVATLVARGIDGCEAHVLRAAEGAVTRDMQLRARGWSEDEWAAADQRLRARGWIGDDGGLTEAGIQVRADIERKTDELSAAPYEQLGAAGCAELREILEPLASRIVAGGGVPFPNPMGLTPPRS